MFEQLGCAKENKKQVYISALGELIWLSQETSVLARTKQMCFTLPVSQSPIWLYQAVDFILYSASWIW